MSAVATVKQRSGVHLSVCLSIPHVVIHQNSIQQQIHHWLVDHAILAVGRGQHMFRSCCMRADAVVNSSYQCNTHTHCWTAILQTYNACRKYLENWVKYCTKWRVICCSDCSSPDFCEHLTINNNNNSSSDNVSQVDAVMTQHTASRWIWLDGKMLSSENGREWNQLVEW